MKSCINFTTKLHRQQMYSSETLRKLHSECKKLKFMHQDKRRKIKNQLQKPISGLHKKAVGKQED